MDANREHGAVIVVVALALTALLGMAALAIDTGLFSAHRRQLQTAADAAALAGAQQLISNPSLACATAGRYARENTDLTSSTNLIKHANLDTSFCELLPTSGSSTPNSVAVRPVESSVPYLFGGVFGLTTANANASASSKQESASDWPPSQTGRTRRHRRKAPPPSSQAARESSTASGRIVPVDLRSFERERLGWLARRRSAGVSQRRLVDRTGQPPSWETQNEHDAAPGIAQSANQPASVGPSSAENTSPPGEDLAAKLRGILLRGDQQS